ncbi:MAG: hypothetical protein ACFFCS_11160 [Candidatus Hodarchaeota archaeon]
MEFQEDDYICFCQKCNEYIPLMDFNGTEICTSCNTQPLKLIQVCPECNNWYLVDKKVGEGCKDCKVNLRNLTEEEKTGLAQSEKLERKAMVEHVKPTEITTTKPSSQKQGRDKEDDEEDEEKIVGLVKIRKEHNKRKKKKLEKKEVEERRKKKKKKAKELKIQDKTDEIEIWPEFKKLKEKDIELKDGTSFKEYIDWIEREKPYGPNRDKYGELYIFPNQPPLSVAWSEDMKREDEMDGLFERLFGLDSKFKPPVLIAMLLVFPNMLLSPLFYMMNEAEWTLNITLADYSQKLIAGGAIFGILVFLSYLMSYSLNKLNNLLKPYGKDKESLELLFINKLEFYKHGKKVFHSVFNMKWWAVGAIAGAGAAIGLFWNGYPAYMTNLRIAIPGWTFITIILQNIAISLMVLLLAIFLCGILSGLTTITNLADDRSKLSVEKFREMIENVTKRVSKAQTLKTTLKDGEGDLIATGRTYFEFQRGNRKIGEFLFSLATIMIMVCVLIAVMLFLLNILNFLPAHFEASMNIWTVGITVVGVLSLLIFILPQVSIHQYLQKFKYSLIDSYSELISRLEYIYFESMVDRSVLSRISENWEEKTDVIEDINLLKEMIEEVKSYGTWAYDFPEVMKLIAVAASTVIPFLLGLF